MTAIRKGIRYRISAGRIQKVLAAGRRYAFVVLTEERALRQARGKMRKLRRMRRLSRVIYWATWAIVGIVFVALVAGGIVGLASA
jgi:hypothetical protein